jgi:hypothetical protein
MTFEKVEEQLTCSNPIHIKILSFVKALLRKTKFKKLYFILFVILAYLLSNLFSLPLDRVNNIYL